MRVLVIGASHGLGREVVRKAVAEGHRVTAFARHPENVGISHERLKLCRGDATSATDVTKAMKDQRAVIITLGLPTKQALGFGHSLVLSGGTANVLEAMQRHGVKRLILETAIGTGESKRSLGPLYRLALRGVLRYVFNEKDTQEVLVRESDTDWTIVRPSTMTYGQPTGSYLIDPPMSFGMFTHIARADVAEFIVRQLDEPTKVRQAVTISYPRRGWWDFPGWLADYRPRD